MEAKLSYDRNTWGSDYISNSNDIDLSYFFSPVDSKTYPYKEAAFMARSSAVSVQLSDGDTKYSYDNSNDASLALRLTYADPGHPYALAGEASKEKRKSLGADVDNITL